MICKPDLQNSQKSERGTKGQTRMNAAGYVETACEMVQSIDRHIAAAGLDRDGEESRLVARHGLSRRILWDLRYRPPKSIAAHFYFGLCDALEELALKTVRLADHDISKARALKRSPNSRLLGAAADLAGAALALTRDPTSED